VSENRSNPSRAEWAASGCFDPKAANERFKATYQRGYEGPGLGITIASSKFYLCNCDLRRLDVDMIEAVSNSGRLDTPRNIF
jgi:hypothetical protein